MTNKNKQLGLTILLMSAVLLSVPLKAQVTIGELTAPDINAVLDLRANTKLGLLLPRLPLQSTTLAAPMSLHVAGMVVYNTATTGDVTPGFYYNNGAKWIAVGSGGGITVEADGVIGNEVTDVANTTLVRTGSGTAADPYKLARAAITGDVSIPAASNTATIDAIKGQTLPATAPTGSGQTLASDGAGHLTWQTIPGIVPGVVKGKLQTLSTSAYTVTGDDYVVITTTNGGCNVTLPDLPAANIGNTVIIFNNNPDNSANTITATHIVGATNNNYSRAIMLVWSGAIWMTVSTS